MVQRVVVISVIVAAAAGLLIGGLIGHFATPKDDSTTETTTQSPSGSGAQTNPNIKDDAKDRKNREILFSKVDTEELRKTEREFSRLPHLAGSARNNELGDKMAETWRDYGFTVKKYEYDILLSYPGKDDTMNQAEILNSSDDVEFNTSLVEENLANLPGDLVPPFNGYAKAGTVESNTVYYVNYCTDEDFKYMESKSYNVSNTLVICRYGKIFRGNKVAFAQKYGAIGLMLFNDPQENVYLTNETFPNGWYLPPTGVERGGTALQKGDPLTLGYPAKGNQMVILAEKYGAIGVLMYNDPGETVDLSRMNATAEDTFPNSWFMPPTGVERGSIMDFSGDPLTPGYPSKEYAWRKTVEQVREEAIIPNIPTQPIPYGEMVKFLEQMSGPEVDKDDWKGKLTISYPSVTYKFGGELLGGRKFRIKNYNQDQRNNITNVFGIIKGSVEPDRYVLMGNHRDAWMNGATDAVSGTSTMMETSRVFSELMKTGWRPRRSIVFCSWDGEEYGIIGSIEWLDEVKAVLNARAVAYMNCDSGVVYHHVLRAAASPLMYKLMYDSAKQVKLANATDPERTMYDEWYARSANTEAWNYTRARIGDLGSGSDHTGFFHRHGITSMDAVYYYDKAEIPGVSAYYPLYHTSYDTFMNVERFVDPSFSFHKMLTQFFTELVRSTADSVMIPFVISDYTMRLKEVRVKLDDAVRTKLADKGLAKSLDELKTAIDKFGEAATEFDAKVQAVDDKTSWSEVRRLNDQLLHLERAFLYDLGIGNRKYIKHVVFAPAATDSYSSAAFPGITDALYEIADNDDAAWEGVKEELMKAVYTMESATQAITVDLIV